MATEHHHKPSDIASLAEKYPETRRLIVTHTYVDSDYLIVTTEVPDFPGNVTHGEDGMCFEIDSNGSVL